MPLKDIRLVIVRSPAKSATTFSIGCQRTDDGKKFIYPPNGVQLYPFGGDEEIRVDTSDKNEARAFQVYESIPAKLQAYLARGNDILLKEAVCYARMLTAFEESKDNIPNLLFEDFKAATIRETPVYPYCNDGVWWAAEVENFDALKSDIVAAIDSVCDLGATGHPEKELKTLEFALDNCELDKAGWEKLESRMKNLPGSTLLGPPYNKVYNYTSAPISDDTRKRVALSSNDNDDIAAIEKEITELENKISNTETRLQNLAGREAADEADYREKLEVAIDVVCTLTTNSKVLQVETEAKRDEGAAPLKGLFLKESTCTIGGTNFTVTLVEYTEDLVPVKVHLDAEVESDFTGNLEFLTTYANYVDACTEAANDYRNADNFGRGNRKKQKTVKAQLEWANGFLVYEPKTEFESEQQQIENEMAVYVRENNTGAGGANIQATYRNTIEAQKRKALADKQAIKDKESDENKHAYKVGEAFKAFGNLCPQFATILQLRGQENQYSVARCEGPAKELLCKLETAYFTAVSNETSLTSRHQLVKLTAMRTWFLVLLVRLWPVFGAGAGEWFADADKYNVRYNVRAMEGFTTIVAEARNRAFPKEYVKGLINYQTDFNKNIVATHGYAQTGLAGMFAYIGSVDREVDVEKIFEKVATQTEQNHDYLNDFEPLGDTSGFTEETIRAFHCSLAETFRQLNAETSGSTDPTKRDFPINCGPNAHNLSATSAYVSSNSRLILEASLDDAFRECKPLPGAGALATHGEWRVFVKSVVKCFRQAAMTMQIIVGEEEFVRRAGLGPTTFVENTEDATIEADGESEETARETDPFFEAVAKVVPFLSGLAGMGVPIAPLDPRVAADVATAQANLDELRKKRDAARRQLRKEWNDFRERTSLDMRLEDALDELYSVQTINKIDATGVLALHTKFAEVDANYGFALEELKENSRLNMQAIRTQNEEEVRENLKLLCAALFFGDLLPARLNKELIRGPGSISLDYLCQSYRMYPVAYDYDKVGNLYTYVTGRDAAGVNWESRGILDSKANDLHTFENTVDKLLVAASREANNALIYTGKTAVGKFVEYVSDYLIYQKLQDISDAESTRLCKTFKKGLAKGKRKRVKCEGDAREFKVLIDLLTPFYGIDETADARKYKQFIINELQLFQREVNLGQKQLYFHHYWLVHDFGTPPFVEGGRRRTKVTLKTIREQGETITSFFFNFLFSSFYDKVENLIQRIVDEKVDDVARKRGVELKQMQSQEMERVQGFFSGRLEVVKLADELFSLAFLIAIDKKATKYNTKIKARLELNQAWKKFRTVAGLDENLRFEDALDEIYEEKSMNGIDAAQLIELHERGRDFNEQTEEDIRTVASIILEAVDTATEEQMKKGILYNADTLGLEGMINPKFVTLVNDILETVDEEDITADSDSDESEADEMMETSEASDSDDDSDSEYTL